MGEYSLRGRLASVVLVVGLAYALTISGGCKQKVPPGDAQQSVVDQETEPGSTSEVVADRGTSVKHDLRILYVGLPNTERQKDFVSFLSMNFTEVKTADLYAFKEEQTKDSDVVILDKDGIQWGSRGGKPLSDLKVSDQYSRSTISLGIPGAFWTDRMRLKTGYM